MKLKVGDIAPDFNLPDSTGKMHRLADYRGQKTVVYFYPKDNTPGCTRQACAFRDSFAALQELNAAVFGISRDGGESHLKFAEKYNLPFILLSDPELKAVEAYGAWQQKTSFGKTYMGIVRSTFVIGENGVIIKIFPKANPDTNAADIIQFLKSSDS